MPWWLWVLISVFAYAALCVETWRRLTWKLEERDHPDPGFDAGMLIAFVPPVAFVIAFLFPSLEPKPPRHVRKAEEREERLRELETENKRMEELLGL